MEKRLLGIVKSQAEEPNKFLFITSFKDLKNNDYVYFEKEISGKIRKILSRTVFKKLIKTYPDIFFKEADISPFEISKILGINETYSELYEVETEVLGWFDEILKDFVNPHTIPAQGDEIYYADFDFLASVISSKKQKEKGSIHIGNLLIRDEEIPIVLDGKSLVSTHLAILAATGAGKSYTIGVILEELIKPYNKASILIVDPHFEYSTLKEIEGISSFKDKDYLPKIKIFNADNFNIRFSSLDIQDLLYLMPNLTEKMKHFLENAFRELKSREKTSNQWDVNTLKGILLDKIANKEVQESDIMTINAITWRLDKVFSYNKIFSSHKNTPLKEIFKPGQISIFQFQNISEDHQAVIIATILRKSYEARISYLKGNQNAQDEDYLPMPIFALIEEAHRFIPQNDRTVVTNIIRRILSEGRKFGVGVGIISQRPGKVDQDVLSQCMSQIIMKIVNPIDQSSVASSIESIGKDLIKELPSLSKGEAIISGVSINMPVLAKIRKRETSHGGETLDAPDEWEKAYKLYIDLEKRSDSLLIQEKKGERIKGFDV